MATRSRKTADLTVVGAGGAGLFVALQAARRGARVALVSSTPLAQTASYWAQGGLAAALARDDSPELHLRDTEAAGRGLVRRSAAEVLCGEAPLRVRELEDLGVRFDADRHGQLALGLEGGHSVRRVVHAGGSATGRRVVRQLSALVVEEPRITVVEGTRVTGLLVGDEGCVGVSCEDGRTLLGGSVAICSGGAAALWARTTNPPGSLGSGLVLAHRAGAKLADLEFVQFHPTAVTGVPGREGFLISEALRGEGATLHDAAGERFVDELAPRDEVARAIHERMQASGATSVGLDLRGIDPARFPNVFAALRDAGVDPANELVPVAPAAHYMMGGIVTDLFGRSTLPGLFAAGEAACTGLHGANRLASNSLSECFVFGARLAEHALDSPVFSAQPRLVEGELLDREAVQGTRARLWECAGIARTGAQLSTLLDDPHPLARLIARCALARTESRGSHLRLDFPETDQGLDRRHAVVDPTGELRFERWK